MGFKPKNNQIISGKTNKSCQKPQLDSNSPILMDSELSEMDKNKRLVFLQQLGRGLRMEKSTVVGIAVEGITQKDIDRAHFLESIVKNIMEESNDKDILIKWEFQQGKG